ncbi:MAG: hypothetical protein P8Q97_08090 [Myxococcota bacterium]|jgi:hypothetical protein|nr:hypothetical protein [Myxococcota bacterium]
MDRNRKVPQRTPPDTLEEALGQSLEHARASASEALMAARLLLDALSILLANEPVVRHAEHNSPIGYLASSIERWASSLRPPENRPNSPDFPAVLGAVEQEIERWAGRAQDDADARTVLHAFLGMREILWELDAAPAKRTVRNPARSARASRVSRKTAAGGFNP